MRIGQFGVVGIILLLASLGSTAALATVVELDSFGSPEPMAGDSFGGSLAMSGDLMIAGAKDGAFVFRNGGGGFSLEQKLTNSDAVRVRAVDIEGDVAILGAETATGATANSGAAYVFRFDGMSWVEAQKLMPADGLAFDNFGHAVSVSGDLIVVGAPGDDDGADKSGSVYVYRDGGAGFALEDTLRAGDAEADDALGWSVDVDGDAVAAGAYLEDEGVVNAGAVYVFRYAASSWGEEAKLVASDANIQARLGYSVSLAGDMLVAGAMLDSEGTVFAAGAGYVFSRTGGVWSEDAKLKADDAAGDDHFGRSVATDGTRILIGSPDATIGAAANHGAAYLYQGSGSSWSEEKFFGTGLVTGDIFGSAVALDGGTALVGAPASAGYGRTFVFSVPEPTLALAQTSALLALAALRRRRGRQAGRAGRV